MLITDRIDAITKISAKYLGTIIPAPKSVKIEITATCNYNCSFCTKSLNKASGAMDRAMYSRVIREMRAAGVEELGVFYIGESFTCPWVAEAIAEAKTVGFPYVFLTTNGAAATPEKVEACMASGLDSLKFSLNFTDPAQLKEVAQVSGRNWQLAIDHLKAAREIRDAKGYATKIYASSIAFDGAQGDKMRAVVDQITPYVDQHYWLPLYGMSGAAKAAGMQPQPGNPGRLAALREPLPCWSVFTEGHVTKDGLLSACCFGNGSTDTLVMADLTQVSFMEGWNSLKYRELRAAHLGKDVSKTACAGCMSA
ncbi:MAG: radical SAM protein [Betaproteobacteria bacterium]|nr:radical SAM protein [Betaproteobacteria bacterium]